MGAKGVEGFDFVPLIACLVFAVFVVSFGLGMAACWI